MEDSRVLSSKKLSSLFYWNKQQKDITLKGDISVQKELYANVKKKMIHLLVAVKGQIT